MSADGFNAEISYLLLDPIKDGRRFRVVDDVHYVHGDFRCVVPKGTETDFASIPGPRAFVFASLLAAWGVGLFFGLFAAKAFIIVALVAFTLAGSLGKWGRYGWAAILHDYLYSKAAAHLNVSRAEADRLFLVFMKLRDTPAIQSLFIYCAVRAFGWLFYQREKS